MRSVGAAQAGALVAALSLACGSRPVARPPAAPAKSSGSPSASAAPLAPPAGAAATERFEETVEALEVPGFLPSLIVTPSSGGPSPVVVVAHGAGGAPEPHCDFYRALVRGRAFILCTRGRSIDRFLPEGERGYFYDGHHELGKELRAALDALAARHGARVDRERTVYAGFSQGASMGILALQQGAQTEARAQGILLVEGGFAEWTVALAQKLRDEGARRVALVCGRPVCKEDADRSAGWIRRGGLEVDVLYAEGAGHTYGGEVAPLVADAFQWIVADDPRWRASP